MSFEGWADLVCMCLLTFLLPSPMNYVCFRGKKVVELAEQSNSFNRRKKSENENPCEHVRDYLRYLTFKARLNIYLSLYNGHGRWAWEKCTANLRHGKTVINIKICCAESNNANSGNEREYLDKWK